jgi:uncharacterized protein
MGAELDLETLIKEVANAEQVPDAALAALMAHAGELTPRLEALARRRMEGDWLYPSEDTLLFYGLFVLAAAKERGFWPTWAEMLSVADDGLEGLFGDGAPMSIRAITLGLVGSDAEPVAELVTRAELASDARAGLTEALARLMCEGKYPRDKFVALIDALATLEGTDDDDRCKWCVEEAIVLGGIGERAELLDHLWRTGAFSIWNDADKAEAREVLAAAIARPTDLTRFDEDGIAAPKTPADALRWLKSIQQHDRESDGVAGLTWREREWLASFLEQTVSPDAAMSFEELDGFFHALVIGPDLVMPSEYLAEVWGEGPEFENEAQVREVMGLIQRHWNAIAGRQAAGAPPVMWLEPHDDEAPGTRWACGFARGVGLRAQSWQSLAEDEAAAMALDCILALESDAIEPWERSEFLHMLGDHVATLAEFWRELRSPCIPLRVQKVGRNEPCPCGSGKKWKKCCGATPPPIVH